MKIILSPVRDDRQLVLQRAGDVLTFNDVAVDLANYDATIAPNDWIVGDPISTPAGWDVTVVLPCGANAPLEARYPVPVTVVGDGPIALPSSDQPPANDSGMAPD